MGPMTCDIFPSMGNAGFISSTVGLGFVLMA